MLKKRVLVRRVYHAPLSGLLVVLLLFTGSPRIARADDCASEVIDALVEGRNAIPFTLDSLSEALRQFYGMRTKLQEEYQLVPLNRGVQTELSTEPRTGQGWRGIHSPKDINEWFWRVLDENEKGFGERCAGIPDRIASILPKPSALDPSRYIYHDRYTGSAPLGYVFTPETLETQLVPALTSAYASMRSWSLLEPVCYPSSATLGAVVGIFGAVLGSGLDVSPPTYGEALVNGILLALLILSGLFGGAHVGAYIDYLATDRGVFAHNRWVDSLFSTLMEGIEDTYFDSKTGLGAYVGLTVPRFFDTGRKGYQTIDLMVTKGGREPEDTRLSLIISPKLSVDQKASPQERPLRFKLVEASE